MATDKPNLCFHFTLIFHHCSVSPSVCLCISNLTKTFRFSFRLSFGSLSFTVFSAAHTQPSPFGREFNSIGRLSLSSSNHAPFLFFSSSKPSTLANFHRLPCAFSLVSAYKLFRFSVYSLTNLVCINYQLTEKTTFFWCSTFEIKKLKKTQNADSLSFLSFIARWKGKKEKEKISNKNDFRIRLQRNGLLATRLICT